MIPAFLEGVTQALLPCSWVVLVPALLIGVSTRRWAAPLAFMGSVALFVWVAVSGWLSPPLWMSGLLLVAAAGHWWFRGIEGGSGLVIGAAAAWAWRPCVGAELASALNLAQQDPVGALPGLAAFMIGVVAMGLGIGWAVSQVLKRFDRSVPRRMGAVVIGAFGLAVVFGLYGTLYSELARWSSSIWG